MIFISGGVSDGVFVSDRSNTDIFPFEFVLLVFLHLNIKNL